MERLAVLESDSVTTVNCISGIGEVDLVSSALVDMKDWIEDRNFEFNKVVYTHQKSSLNYDVFIEDSPYEALNIVKNNKICLLYDQPWNRFLQPNSSLLRVENLKESKRLIKEIRKDNSRLYS